MWAVNYIKCASVGGSHDVTTVVVNAHDADGALMFCKTY